MIRPTGSYRFCELEKKDLDQAVALACCVFSQDRFYRDLTRFTAEAFRAYWQEFIPLVLAEPKAHLYGVKKGEKVVGLLVAAEPHFPGAGKGLAFLLNLGGKIGPVHLLKYLGFVRKWSRLMRRPARERRTELQGLWVLVDGPHRGILLGLRLIAWVMAQAAAEGKTLFTGFIDAEEPGLATFYKRLGFTVSEPFLFRGKPAATIVLRREEAGR